MKICLEATFFISCALLTFQNSELFDRLGQTQSVLLANAFVKVYPLRCEVVARRLCLLYVALLQLVLDVQSMLVLLPYTSQIHYLIWHGLPLTLAQRYCMLYFHLRRQSKYDRWLASFSWHTSHGNGNEVTHS